MRVEVLDCHVIGIESHVIWIETHVNAVSLIADDHHDGMLANLGRTRASCSRDVRWKTYSTLSTMQSMHHGLYIRLPAKTRQMT